jgi:hypothetical protein
LHDHCVKLSVAGSGDARLAEGATPGDGFLVAGD